jgi:hypothetical protein
MSSNNRLNNVVMTPTTERATPRNEFGDILKSTLQTGAGVVSGALGVIGGGSPVVSAAVSSLTNFANKGSGPAVGTAVSAGIQSAGGAQTVGQAASSGGVNVTQANTGDMNDQLTRMRQEADRSMLMQMKMQDESREYNTISNVLKVRHDSAKAAINNIR